MTDIRSLAFFGSLLPPEVVPRLPAASEGANRAQLALVRGFVEHGVDEVVSITGLPVKGFPFGGPPVVGGHTWALAPGIDIVAPSYANVIPSKPVTMHVAFRRRGLVAARRARAQIVLAFNPVPGFGSAALAVARRLGVPFVLIVADYTPLERAPHGLRALQSSWSRRVLLASDGLVVFSGHTARDLGYQGRWIKVDAGVDEDWTKINPVPLRPRTAVYSGSLTPDAGLGLLLEAFRLIQDDSARLDITGRGPLEDDVRRAAARDHRIIYHGLLSRQAFQQLLAGATVLVNPRLSSDVANRYNFPSKLPDYLASGRPVVTTLAGDLDPAYLDVVIPVHRERPADLASAIEDVLGWPEERRSEIGRRGRQFILRDRGWSDQSARVLELAEQILARAGGAP